MVSCQTSLTLTSTAIFKALISLKTRNGIIFSPHPRAKLAANRAAEIVLNAAIAAGAPKDIIETDRCKPSQWHYPMH